MSSCNYGSIKNPFYLKDNQILWSFYMQKIKEQRKVSAHVSMRGLRRLTWIDTFRKFIKPPLHRTLVIYWIHIETKFCYIKKIIFKMRIPIDK